jgi:hypothetical protein
MSIELLVKTLEQAKLSWMQGEEIKIEFIDACIDLGKQAIAEAEKQSATHGEPVGYVGWGGDVEWYGERPYAETSLYTHPYVPTERQPKRNVATPREWVGLTQNQINSICEMSEIAAAVIATELLLKENNT